MKTMIQGWDRYSNEPPLKQLARKFSEMQLKKNPTVPEYAIRKKTFHDQRANDLTQAIISFFTVIGGMAERVSNTGRQIDRKGSTIWIYGTGKNGTADICSVWEGLSIKVEVKAGKDRQSEAQKAYQEQIRKAGGIYLIARSFDGFLYEFFKAVEGLRDGA
ncbi:MAG: hypothetical protein C0433_14425 [Cyclobacterium sp.]|nr:hypothetical protein [Cyclobacterium sp.]